MKKPLLDLPMPIITKHLLIRKPIIGDEKALNAAVVETYDQLKFTMPWAKTCPTLADTAKFVQEAVANWEVMENKAPYFPLLIFDRQTHNLVGASGFNTIDWEIPGVEIGYWLRKQYVGRGWMTEAVVAQANYAMQYMKAKRVEIRCDMLNIRSQQVAIRAGFHLETTLKHNTTNLATGKLSDTLVYVKRA